MNIDIKDVKRLREETLAGLMSCKEALKDSDGDFEAAKEYLKVKGLSIANKKSTKSTSDGLLIAAVSEDCSYGLMVELNSETDFVALNEHFQSLLQSIAKVGLENRVDSIKSLQEIAMGSNASSVQEEINRCISIVGENIQLNKLCNLSVEEGVVSSYVHGGQSTDMGKIAALISLESPTGDKDKLRELGKKIAMHVVASKPLALSLDQLPKEVIEREREVVAQQMKMINKPQDVINKIIDGKINKYYSEVVLLQQPFIMSDKITISQLLSQYETIVGDKINLVNYKLLVLGNKV